MSIATIAIVISLPAAAQQLPDPDFVPRVPAPAFARGAGPVVALDAGHANFHTLDGRYAPFGKVLEADGYRVRGVSGTFTAASLAPIAVLVIANPGMDGDASWALPTPSAYTDAEIAAVHAWVEGGGSLLLQADHMPAAGATAALGQAFGLRFTNGYSFQPRPNGQPGDIFTRSDGSLYDHPIMRGRNRAERVDSVLTFTGQAFQATVPVDTLLRFGPDAVTLLPVEAGPGAGLDNRTPRVYSGGWLHGVALRVGAGRVVVFGEAAMFSAQIAGPQRLPMGMNHPLASHNQQLLLNTLHWLTERVPGAGSREPSVGKR